MIELLSANEIKFIGGVIAIFLGLIAALFTLYKSNVEKTIKSQADLTNQKLDLNHEKILIIVTEIKAQGADHKRIALEAHAAVNQHVLNYHRQG